MSVLQIGSHEHVIDKANALQRLCSFRNDHFPVGAFGFASVNGNDFAARGIKISLKPKDRTIVVNDAPENFTHFKSSVRSFPVSTSRTFHSCQSDPEAERL